MGGGKEDDDAAQLTDPDDRSRPPGLKGPIPREALEEEDFDEAFDAADLAKGDVLVLLRPGTKGSILIDDAINKSMDVNNLSPLLSLQPCVEADLWRSADCMSADCRRFADSKSAFGENPRPTV